MYRRRALVLLASLLFHSSHAQTTDAPAAAASSTREPLTRTINVAKAAHSFTPNVVQAEVGDFVEFRFYPTNHSVVRAAYKHPCVPYEMVEVDKEGMFSGFHPVDAILDDPPKWQVRINDTDPIFFYCSAPGSCINYGMVGVINPNATTSVEVQKNEAERSTFMLQPGQPWPDESDPPEGISPRPSSSGTSATSSPTATAPASTTPSTTPAPKSGGLAAGAIAGIAIGAAAVALMAAVLVYMCGRNRALSDLLHPNRHRPSQSMDFESNGVHSVQYIPKHMSSMTMTTSGRPDHGAMGGYMPQSPALPGYNGPHDGVVSAQPRVAPYMPSDALSPANSGLRSPSPGSTVVPAYSSTSPPPMPLVDPSEHGVHEMDAAGQRRNSMNKGGVERYS